MKNLKKVLALGLALVMLLGMFTVASAAEAKKVASELSDYSTIADDHKDAVNLNVDLGIITGKDDGTFAPTANIDRASWAKMVYFAATGTDDADAYLDTANSLLNDIKGNWAESFISYLAAMNYVSGDENGNYNPSNNVTVAEACKMMLTVLGYDAKDRGYQNNSNWAGNIMTDAKRNGLMDNVDKAQTALVPLTRENAAQIVYNALDANMVEGEPQWDEGNKYITRYNKQDPLGYYVFNLIKVTATVKELDTDGKAVLDNLECDNVDADDLAKVSAKANKKIPGTAANVGQKVTFFVSGDAEFSVGSPTASGKCYEITSVDELVSSSLAAADSNLLATLSKGYKDSDTDTAAAHTAKLAVVFDDEEDDYVADLQVKENDETKTAATVYVNGAEEAWGDDTIATLALGTKAAAAIQDRGNVIELYDNDSDGDVDTIKITEYNVAQLTGDVETRTKDKKLYVMVPGVIDNWNTEAEKVTGYQGLVEDDVVLWYKDAKADTVVIEKAEKVTGKVTGKSSSKITVGGTSYNESGIAGTSNEKAFASWTDYDNEYDFYLDKNGAVCLTDKLTDDISDNVLLVLEAGDNGASGLNSSSKAMANVLFTDGTKETITIDKVVDASGAEIDKDADGDPTKVENQIAALGGSKDSKASIATGFWNYKVKSNGNYELTAIEHGDTDIDDGDVAVGAEDDTVKIEGKTALGTGATVDNKTLYIVEKSTKGLNDDDATYAVYTGYKNVPDMDAAYGVAAVDENDVAKYVFLTTGAYSDETPDGLLVLVDSDGTYVDADECTYYKVMKADGSVDTVAVEDSTEMKAVFGDKTNENKFIRVKSVADGKISDAEALTATTADDTNKVYSNVLESIGNGVLTMTSSGSFAYDDTTVCVVIDLDGNDGDFDTATTFKPDSFKLTTASYDYTAYVVGEKDGDPVDYIYVVRNPKA